MSTRLSFADDGTNAAAYSYLANSPLVGQFVFASNTVTRMTTSKQYDFLNRLSSMASTPSNSFTYQYNAANQRTLDRLWDGSYWRYQYDALGQVISGNKFWNDQTPVAGQQFGYTFDTIGNRTQTEAGGDQIGANLREANYTNNSLNQITSRSVPGYVDVTGDGLATNGVTVNSETAYRKNEYFRQQLSVANTSAAVWDSVTVAAPGQTSVTGHIFVPQTPESYTYDADGNETSDGRFTYSWNGENRLTNITSLSGGPSGSLVELALTYDSMGRRIQKLVSTNNGSGYVASYTNTFVYDGWNLTGVFDGYGNLLYSFQWGSDLSGSMQGAGGVGGLISMTVYTGANAGTYFYCYDGNGNVTALVSAANGATAATYEYGPFGELIRASGPMAKVNPFRFSTKYDDDETDLLYYGYRYYNPSMGRWLSRDPFKHQRGANAYEFVRNSPTTSIDPDGRYTITWLEGNLTLCGGWNAYWLLNFGETYVGDHEGLVNYFVQKVTLTKFAKHCSSPVFEQSTETWFEALQVPAANSILANSYTTDHDSEASIFGSIGGFQSVRVVSRIFPASEVESDILQWPNNESQAGGMKSTTNAADPPWWDDFVDQATRSTKVSGWNCCCCDHCSPGTLTHDP